MSEQSYRADLLQSQALVACYNAMSGCEVHVYGNNGYSWRGTRIDSHSRLTSSTHWTDDEGTWKYDVIVGVEIRRTLVKPRNQP